MQALFDFKSWFLVKEVASGATQRVTTSRPNLTCHVKDDLVYCEDGASLSLETHLGPDGFCRLRSKASSATSFLASSCFPSCSMSSCVFCKTISEQCKQCCAGVATQAAPLGVGTALKCLMLWFKRDSVTAAQGRNRCGHSQIQLGRFLHKCARGAKTQQTMSKLSEEHLHRPGPATCCPTQTF